MKLIELTGLPGSGKTFILSILLNAMKKKGISVFSANDVINMTIFPFYIFRSKYFVKQIERLYRLLRIDKKYQNIFVNNNPELFSFVNRYANKFNKNTSDKIIDWFLYTAGIYQIAIDILPSESFLLLDEGFVHKSTNLFASFNKSNLPENLIRKYIYLIPNVDFIIEIISIKDMCIRERLINPTFRLKNRDKSQIINFFNNIEQIIGISINYAKNRHSLLIHIENDFTNLKYRQISEIITKIKDNKK